MNKEWLKITTIGLALVLLLGFSAMSQVLKWEVDLRGFADNREYKSSVQIPQTMFGVTLIPELKFSFDSLHTIGTGISALKEFGSQELTDKLNMQIYYRFKGQLFEFTFGSFNRYDLFKNEPKAIYYDSLFYYKPNLTGLHWKIKHGRFRQSVYLDWTGRQTDTQRETFIMGGFGEFTSGNLFVKNHIYMYHYALTSVHVPGNRLRDNGVIYLNVGYNASGMAGIDSLSISAGGIQSMERTRGLSGWHFPKGVMICFDAAHKGFGISNTTYIGEGHSLDWGDPFYKLKRYSRFDIYFTPLVFKGVNATFGISLHLAEKKVNYQQQFFLRAVIGSKDRK